MDVDTLPSDWTRIRNRLEAYHAARTFICHPTRTFQRDVQWRDGGPTGDGRAAPPFHLVTTGIEAALDQARAAAQGKDVRIGGGAAIRQA